MLTHSSHVAFEPLERRSLMSAVVVGSTLRVTGTEGDDEIHVENNTDSSKVDVTVNGDTTTFSKSGLRKVRVFAGHGDDILTMGDNIRLAVGLHGQRGDDELFGNNERNLLVGGHDDDYLSGGRGFDWIMGMQGEDEFDGADERREYADLTEEDGEIIRMIDAPQAVRTAATELLAGQTEFTLIRERDDQGQVFELEWETAAGQPHSAKIKPNGDVVELEKEIDIEDLPDAAVQAILARYPTGSITEAETVEVPGQPLAYEVETVVRRTIREIVVSPTGVILKDEIEGYVRT